eukprot:3168837-Alexandrium_andersonii.AAC.1
MAFIAARHATFALPSGKRACRPVLAGVGAGGPIKPCLWCLAFGPVIVTAFSANRASTPALIGDVSCRSVP